MKTLEFKLEFSEALEARAAPVIVTGAGGWLGQAALEMLGDSTRIIAFGASARDTTLRSGHKINVRPLEEIATLTLPGAIIFHFAFLTREHASAMPLSDYISGNQKISCLIQDFIARCGTSGVFLPSSGAVYAGSEMSKNPYGVLKREDEEIFLRLATQQGFPAAIMRVFNLSGPFINKLNSYALACILSDILNARPVTLRASHPVWRGYAHVQDVLNIGLGSLLTQAPAAIFDSAGEAIEVGDLALRAGRLLTGKTIEIIRPAWQDAPEDRYLGDPAQFTRRAESLGVPLHNLDQQILDTADYLRI